MSEEKVEYPCDDCKDELKCVPQSKYKRCVRWLAWFSQQWRALQKKFALDVSNRHRKKGGDDK